MRTTINQNDSFYVQSPENGVAFSVTGVGYESVKISASTAIQYIEVRRKNDKVAVFFFRSKRHKRECDLEWWNDAEVVYAVNEVNK